jgi:hypothetical protein
MTWTPIPRKVHDQVGLKTLDRLEPETHRLLVMERIHFLEVV